MRLALRIFLIFLFNHSTIAWKPVGLSKYKKLAESGDPLGQFKMGNIMYQIYRRGGSRTVRTLEEAINWYKLSAEQNFAEAQNAIAKHHESGQGLKQSYAEAIKWWQKAAKQNHADAQFNLGRMYEAGLHVKKDINKALSFYEKAARSGSNDARFRLAEMYENGEGVTLNLNKAYVWYLLGDINGHHKSEKAVIQIAQNMNNEMINKAKNIASRWAEKFGNKTFLTTKSKAEAGDIQKQLELGELYYHGKSMIQNYAKAKYWFERASKHGLAKATYYLAVIYYDGKGQKPNRDKGLKLLLRSAEAGYFKSQSQMAWIYLNKGSLDAYKKALKWYLHAIEKDPHGFMPNLGFKKIEENNKTQDLKHLYLQHSVSSMLCTKSIQKYVNKYSMLGNPTEMLRVGACSKIFNKKKKLRAQLSSQQIMQVDKIEQDWTLWIKANLKKSLWPVW